MGLDIFGNITNGNQTHAWVPEPTVRGTWSILSSCIITILFCIWSAVQLNVPPYNEAKFIHVTHTTWKRMGMLLLGLLAPELVTATAWLVLHSYILCPLNARTDMCSDFQVPASASEVGPNIRSNLFGTMRANQRDEEQANDPGQTYPVAHELWTMRHGFLAIMGGIALDSGGSPEPFTPYQRLTLTASGVERLAKQKPELLSPITTQAIEDKSKANNMAKAIVCVQSAWFCIQCISRFAQNLPISLLEINTFAHAFLAIVIYALWWEKPLDIAEPLLITGPDSWSISALFFTLSIISAPCPKVKGKIQKRLTEGSYVREVGGHHPANSDRVPGCPDHSTRPRGQCSKECEEWAQTTRT
ncbi:hypothetical protein EDB81DRAFT_647346 [Dactylonectria macrodidyma]|uniref:Uncharacterized protein n=1 Tax=Dactylonectria macrodidyma TaxID=307937 RepID=A0A9P9F4L5_9HYPO|nr:hypothetical protein EDB81DRAFT_647346 [Dactylonectria macrodidyma]